MSKHTPATSDGYYEGVIVTNRVANKNTHLYLKDIGTVNMKALI